MNVSALIDVLNREKMGYRALLSLSKLKKQAITDKDIEELNKITKTEQETLVYIIKADAERISVSETLAKKLGLPIETGLSGFIQHFMHLDLKSADAEALNNFKEEFDSLITELKDLNEINNKLIQTQLYFINMTFNLMQDSQEIGITYGADGKEIINERGNFGVIDIDV